MRRGLVIGGVVLLLIGLLMIGASYALNSAGTTQAVPAGSAWSLTPSTIGSSSVTVTWSGAGSGATVYLVSGSVACTGATGIVAQGSGDSGSFTATLTPGTTYSLYACTGASPSAATFKYSAMGITYLILIGIILAIIGIILLAMGMRGGKPAPAPAMST